MNKWFFLSLLLLGAASCHIMPTPKAKKIFQEHGFCYDPKNRVEEQTLSLDGYYDFYGYPKSETGYPKSATVFLKDGRFLGDMGVRVGDFYVKGWELAGPFILNSANFGTYKISGDTIKVGYIFTAFAPWVKAEEWYRIIDNKTIELIACSEQYKRVEETSVVEQKNICKAIGRRYHFVPMDSIPDFNNTWIMKEKWFWCDETAYDKFMSSRK